MISKIKTIFNHPGFRKYFANTGWLFAGRFFQMGIAFFVGVWVARYLGPAKFGLLSFSRSFVGLFMAISTLGLDGIVIRELVKDESKRDVLLGTSFVLKLIGAITALSLVVVSIYFTSTDNLTRLMVILIAASLIFQSFNVIDLYFQSKVVSKFSVFTQMISATLSALLKIYLIISKAPVIYFAAMAIFDMVTIGAGYVYFYRKYTNETLAKWKFKLECAKSLLKDSWPLIFSGIAIGIYMKIDQVMIKYMLDNRAVGIYSVAVNLTSIWFFLSFAIVDSVNPSIIKTRKNNLHIYLSRISYLYGVMFYIGVVIGIFYLFFSKDIVLITYGKNFLPSCKILIVYSWILIFVYWGVINKFVLIAENLQIYRLVSVVIGALVNVFLNYILIQCYGIYGAAIATLVSQIISTVLIYLLWKKTQKLPLIMINSPFKTLKLILP